MDSNNNKENINFHSSDSEAEEQWVPLTHTLDIEPKRTGRSSLGSPIDLNKLDIGSQTSKEVDCWFNMRTEKYENLSNRNSANKVLVDEVEISKLKSDFNICNTRSYNNLPIVNEDINDVFNQPDLTISDLKLKSKNQRRSKSLDRENFSQQINITKDTPKIVASVKTSKIDHLKKPMHQITKIVGNKITKNTSNNEKERAAKKRVEENRKRAEEDRQKLEEKSRRKLEEAEKRRKKAGEDRNLKIHTSKSKKVLAESNSRLAGDIKSNVESTQSKSFNSTSRGAPVFHTARRAELHHDQKEPKVKTTRK